MHKPFATRQRDRALVTALSMVCTTLCTVASLAAEEASQDTGSVSTSAVRERILIDDDWRFIKDDPPECKVSLLYDVRPLRAVGRGAAADSASATEAPPPAVVKPWILPSGNDFLKDSSKAAKRPGSNLGEGVAYIAPDFDD